MQSVRANLRAIAAALLLGQLAGFALLPAALCCEREMPSAELQVSVDKDARPCCPGMTPGQVCPMHRARSQKQDAPRLRCAPDSSNPMALIGLIGILSAPPATDVDFAPAGIVSFSTFDRPAGEITVHSPPPRA
jgi:hypothetical protein